MSERRYPGRRSPLSLWHYWLRASLFCLGLTLTLVAVLAFQFLPSVYQINEGDVSRANIKSPKRVVYVSEIHSKEERDRAAAAVPEQYAQDPSVAAAVQRRVTDTLSRIGEIRQDTATVEQKRVNIGKLGLGLSAGTINDLLGLDEPSWRAAASELSRVVDITMRGPISSAQLADAKAPLPSLASASLDTTQASLVVTLGAIFIQPNVTLDSAAVERSRQAARDAVAPVQVTVEEGEMILREGEIVKTAELEKLQAVGLRSPMIRWSDVASIFLLVLTLAALLSAYVYLFHPDLLFNVRRLLLPMLIIPAALLAAHLTIPGHEYWAYFFPLATVPMLVAALLDPRLAMMVTIVLAPLFATIGGRSLELVVLGIVGCMVGLIGAWRMERFNGIFLTGLGIAVANFLVLLGSQVGTGELTTSRVLLLFFLSAVNGGLSASLTIGFQSLLAHVFGITTTLALLELAHPSQPLFSRLLSDAPGTYHHSVVVANLAERAAHQIGADATLARVAAYYHDIGKVIHPYHFIENQMDGANIHDELEPKVSAQLVVAHVAEGVALAQRHGLPNKVRDIIEQHHGNSWVGFFYRKAKEIGSPDLDPKAFRYSGPRPQTAEAAIVMLADGVEAMVRAGRDHSPEAIAQTVQQSIDDRLAEAQLVECDLTLRDLEQIRTAFITVLQGIFHPRLEYPESPRQTSPLRLIGRRREEARTRLRGGQ